MRKRCKLLFRLLFYPKVPNENVPSVNFLTSEVRKGWSMLASSALTETGQSEVFIDTNL